MSQQLFSYCHNPENTQAWPSAWRAACPIFSQELIEFFAVKMFVIFQFVPSSLLLYRVSVENFVSFWEKTSQSIILAASGLEATEQMHPLNRCNWVPRKRISRGICCPLGFPDQQSAILGLRG